MTFYQKSCLKLSDIILSCNFPIEKNKLKYQITEINPGGGYAAN